MENQILRGSVDPSSDLIVVAGLIMRAKINISKCLINICEMKIAAHYLTTRQLGRVWTKK